MNNQLFRITITKDSKALPVFMITVFGEAHAIAIYREAMMILFDEIPDVEEVTEEVLDIKGDCQVSLEDGSWVPFTKVDPQGRTLTIDDLAFMDADMPIENDILDAFLEFGPLEATF